MHMKQPKTNEDKEIPYDSDESRLSVTVFSKSNNLEVNGNFFLTNNKLKDQGKPASLKILNMNVQILTTEYTMKHL